MRNLLGDAVYTRLMSEQGDPVATVPMLSDAVVPSNPALSTLLGIFGPRTPVVPGEVVFDFPDFYSWFDGVYSRIDFQIDSFCHTPTNYWELDLNTQPGYAVPSVNTVIGGLDTFAPEAIPVKVTFVEDATLGKVSLMPLGAVYPGCGLAGSVDFKGVLSFIPPTPQRPARFSLIGAVGYTGLINGAQRWVYANVNRNGEAFIAGYGFAGAGSIRLASPGCTTMPEYCSITVRKYY